MTLLTYTRFITIPLAVGLGAGNYWLWIELHGVIGGWSLLGLFLTFYGLVPGIFLFVFLENVIEKRFHDSSANSIGQLQAHDVEVIIQAYGKVLETDAPAPGFVADESKLPYPKDTIKKAIIAGLKSLGNDQMKEYLKVSYIQLADWQVGVEPTNQGLDLSAINMNQNTESLAKAVLEKSTGSENWTAKVQNEQETLKQELQELGLW